MRRNGWEDEAVPIETSTVSFCADGPHHGLQRDTGSKAGNFVCTVTAGGTAARVGS